MYIACVQTPPPLSKNGRMGPFSDFYWEEVGGGGGGVCTQDSMYSTRLKSTIMQQKSS